jgi:hypothetical protein
MDPLNYYITTLTTAFKNLAPIALFLVGGYLIFIKGPFLFLRRSMTEQKKKLADEASAPALEKYTVDDYLEFQRRQKKMSGEMATPAEKIAGPPGGGGAKASRPEAKAEPRQEAKRGPRREAPPREKNAERPRTPEEIFELAPGVCLTAEELKKRYFELLKQNHPDRVASMGTEFKKLAEKNTKEINRAYEALKKKAS